MIQTTQKKQKTFWTCLTTSRSLAWLTKLRCRTHYILFLVISDAFLFQLFFLQPLLYYICKSHSCVRADSIQFSAFFSFFSFLCLLVNRMAERKETLKKRRKKIKFHLTSFRPPTPNSQRALIHSQHRREKAATTVEYS